VRRQGLEPRTRGLRVRCSGVLLTQSTSMLRYHAGKIPAIRRGAVPPTDGTYRVVPGHPSKHGANTEAIWSRPLREDHYDDRETGSSAVRRAPRGSRSAVNTVRNFGRADPAADRGPRIDHSSTRDSPPVSPSVIAEALDEQLPIRAERHRPDPIGVPGEGTQLLPGRRVP